jgi:hypothetical protein
MTTAGLKSPTPVERRALGHPPRGDELRTLSCRSRRRGEGSIIVDDGCDVRIGDVPVGAAARLALLHWLPLGPVELDLLDGGLLADDPVVSIALLLRPPTIWSLEDAVWARMLLPLGDPYTWERCEALVALALPRVDRLHLLRLWEAIRRIEGQLPVGGAPTASSTIAAGCAALAGDRDRRRAVVARQLARYAASGVVAARCARLMPTS